MSIQVRDKITPGLATLAHRIGDKRPILEAMGTAALSITTRAFNNPNLRAAPWPVITDLGRQRVEAAARRKIASMMSGL